MCENKKTKKQIEIMRELLNLGGVVASSQWTTGKGKFTKKRTIPNGAYEWERNGIQGNRYHEASVIRNEPLCANILLPKHIKEFFENNPKVQKAIGFINLDEIRKDIEQSNILDKYIRGEYKAKYFKITVGPQSTTVRVSLKMLDKDESYTNIMPENIEALKCYAVYKAVKKIFGKNCFYSGEFENIHRGKIFKTIKNRTDYESVTDTLNLKIEEK